TGAGRAAAGDIRPVAEWRGRRRRGLAGRHAAARPGPAGGDPCTRTRRPCEPARPCRCSRVMGATSLALNSFGRSCPMAFTLPPLPYDYAALEPHIDEQTMRIHHDKHHAAYVNNLNAALEGA